MTSRRKGAKTQRIFVFVLPKFFFASLRLRVKNYYRARSMISTVLVGAALFLGAPAAQALKSDAEQPINIRARSVDVNEKTGVSVYRGDVVMTQGSLRLEADRVEITQRQGRTDLIRAWGKPARIRSRTDAGEEIRARAARAEYRAGERRIDMYGDVELRRGADILAGAVVHYLLDQETFTAEGGEGGQVSAVIQPAKPETAR